MQKLKLKSSKNHSKIQKKIAFGARWTGHSVHKQFTAIGQVYMWSMHCAMSGPCAVHQNSSWLWRGGLLSHGSLSYMLFLHVSLWLPFPPRFLKTLPLPPSLCAQAAVRAIVRTGMQVCATTKACCVGSTSGHKIGRQATLQIKQSSYGVTSKILAHCEVQVDGDLHSALQNQPASIRNSDAAAGARVATVPEGNRQAVQTPA